MKSLRARLMILVLLAVMPAVAVIIHSREENRVEAIHEAHRETLSLAGTVSASYAQVIELTRNLTATLALVPTVRSGSPLICHRFLARILARNPSLANIGVIDRRGDLHCSAVPLKSRVYLGDRPYFKAAIQGRRHVVGSFQVGRVIHTPMVVFATPIITAGRSVRSVVYASLRLSWLDDLAARARLPPRSTLTVLDHGTIIARYPQPQAWLGRTSPALARLVRRLGSRRRLVTVGRGIDGVRQIVAVYRENVTGVGLDPYVIVGIPEAEVFAQGRRILATNLIMLGVAAGLLLAIAWLAGDRLIVRRVRALVTAADRFGAGDLTARARLGGRDELASLGTSFDRMAGLLETNTHDLESQVERVRRLNRIYRVLSATNGAILRIRNRHALFEEACRIAVEHGGHPVAWIGVVAQGSNQVTIGAHAGMDRELLDKMLVSRDAALPQGGGTLGSALRSGLPSICHDVATDPRMTPWRDVLLAAGCHAVATFPLSVAGRVTGSFTIYAEKSGSFDEEEVRLFKEVAVDIALGLEIIETGAQRDHLAHHDPSTGLPNRGYFVDLLDRALRVFARGGGEASVLAVEIPELDEIIDRYGWHQAEEILRELAPRLVERLREGDVVSRLDRHTLGIALLAGSREPVDPEAVAARLLRDFPREVVAQDIPHRLTAFIGAARHEPGMDAETLVRNAEIAVHTLERTTERKFQFFSHQADLREARRHGIGQALHQALEKRELTLLYQPYVDIRTGKVAGAEALLRWHPPGLGPVSPGEFIPIAEQTGYISEIGAWVFRSVLRQARAWNDRGHSPGTVSVNLSARELADRHIVENIKKHLGESGIDLDKCPVAIELTETAAVRDFSRAATALGKLRALGFKIYLDDFGTGYSSLLYLQQMPLDVLKIDLSFIQRIIEDQASLALTRSSISLAHSLNLRVIAEGVETVAQLTLLGELGCDIAQGYLVSRPLPADLLEQFLEKGRGPFPPPGSC